VANAFQSFNEPHAWLIRGLVEYGWRDITGGGGVVPPGAPGGFDVSRIPGSQGKDGLVLVLPAEADGQRVEEGSYEIEVKITGRAPEIKVVARCAECNLLAEYPYDVQNPSWAAGYLHQGLVAHVAEFVRWRQQGGELTWTQRQGLPTIDGDGCSSGLIQFIQRRLRIAGSSFEQGPGEGWWLDAAAAPFGAGPVASVGKGAGDPVYISAAGRKALLGRDGESATVERVAALDAVARPAGWIGIAIGFCIGLGVLWLLNGIVTLYSFGTGRMFALVFSVAFGVALVGGGFLARRGLQRYREVAPHWSVWFMLAYVGLTPLCCLFGLPLAGWGLWVWQKPEVRAGRVVR